MPGIAQLLDVSSAPRTTLGRLEHGTAGLSMSWDCSPRRRRGDVLLEVEEADDAIAERWPPCQITLRRFPRIRPNHRTGSALKLGI